MTHIKQEITTTQHYPCLVFFIINNPTFGKIFTIADVKKPSEEEYGYIVSDLLTLGRQIPPYEEWANKYIESELWRLKQKSTFELSIQKFAVEKFDDISLIRNEEGFVRFVSDEFNEYFGIEK